MFEKYIITSEKPCYEIPDQSVAEFVWNCLKQLNKDFVCLIEGKDNTKLTINELVTKSQCFANALIQRGVHKSDVILFFAENIVEHVIALTAGVLLGLTLYPISPISNIYEMDSLLKTLVSLVIITTKTKVEIINKVLEKNPKINAKLVIILDGVYDNYLPFPQLLEEGMNQTLEKIPYFSVDPMKDTFTFLQSSGTSGVPKSMMISNKAFLATILHFVNQNMFENAIFAHMTPLGCISGVSFLFGYLSRGIPIVVFKEFNEELILKSIEKYKINFMYFTPVFGHNLIAGKLVDKYDLSSLRYMFTGGSAFAGSIGNALVSKYNIRLQERYGMTEHFPITDFCYPTDPEYIPGCVGMPAPNTEVKVIDVNTGENLGPGIDGEICVRGPKNFTQYLNNPSATAEAIDSEGWLRTGDIGHYDRNNHFFITDRLKELIKFGTKQVSPSEIEQFLLTHECIAEVVVVGVKHQTQSQWPRAYVKFKDNMSVTEDEIKKYVSDNLNEAKELRAGVVFVDSIPRTTIGKVDRRHFKQLIKNEVILE